MTYDLNDYSSATQLRRSMISNANSVRYPLPGDETIILLSFLSLPNTSLILSLSNMLLQSITFDLNSVALMYPSFCLLQNILSKEKISCGTRRGDLYYMNDFSLGRTNQIRSIDNAKDREIQLWHQLSGHPYFGFIKHRFLDLFSNVNVVNIKCEACFLAKSHSLLSNQS